MAKPVRMADIAEKASVSLGAVTSVLQGTGKGNIRVGKETAARIKEIAHQLKYRPNIVAQQLAGKRSKMIGLMMSSVPSELTFMRLTHIESHVRAVGYHLMVLYEHLDPVLREEDIDECLQHFLYRGVDGIICMHHTCPTNPLLIPSRVCSVFENAVFIDQPELNNTSYVGPDWVDGARQCVRHLATTGRSKIGLALADIKWHSGPRIKKGYILEHTAQGLTVDEDLIWIADMKLSDHPADLPPEMANRIIDDLVKKKGATAIIATNDYWAGQLVLCLKERDYRVPEDVAVIGWGDCHFVKYVRPMLTSVNLQIEQVASASVDLLIKMLKAKDGEIEQKGFLIKPEIVIRGSA
jgi:DNA-binding LacI/PurR family transcriptional regulator